MSGEKMTHSIPEVAAMLGVSKGLVYAEIHKGALRSVKIGKRILVPKGEVDRLLGAHA